MSEKFLKTPTFKLLSAVVFLARVFSVKALATMMVLSVGLSACVLGPATETAVDGVTDVFVRDVQRTKEINPEIARRIKERRAENAKGFPDLKELTGERPTKLSVQERRILRDVLRESGNVLEEQINSDAEIARKERAKEVAIIRNNRRIVVPLEDVSDELNSALRWDRAQADGERRADTGQKNPSSGGPSLRGRGNRANVEAGNAAAGAPVAPANPEVE